MDIVTESDAYELHPVSGEIDYGELELLKYRRLDEETLQTRVAITSLELVVVYLWCYNDAEGGGSGWRVSEVRPLQEEGLNDSMSWWATIALADDKAKEKSLSDAIQQGESQSLGNGNMNANGVPNCNNGMAEDEDEDDDYWAQYDNTPAGRTPAQKSSPAPPAYNERARSTSEAAYYAQYAQVQPEMDAHDPDEDRNAVGETTLNGDAMGLHGKGQYALNPPRAIGEQRAGANGLMIDAVNDGAAHENVDISQPRATSPPSIQRLQEAAEGQSVAEVAMKQHVSTSIKSLFRLCRSTGMGVSDFEDIVRMELETLSMMTEDD